MISTYPPLASWSAVLQVGVFYYNEFHSLPDNRFPYTGLYPAQGPRGKRPELESQLTSRDTSSKRPSFWYFFSQRRLLGLDPWPSLTRSLPLDMKAR